MCGSNFYESDVSTWESYVCKWQSLQLFDLLRPSCKFCSTYLKIMLLLNVGISILTYGTFILSKVSRQAKVY